MRDDRDLADAGRWLKASMFCIDWRTDDQPPLELWEAFIGAIQDDPAAWHGGELNFEECSDWLADEAGYDFSVTFTVARN